MISVVVPVYNEDESLKTLYGELSSVSGVPALPPDEIIFVDDGSSDASWKVIQGLVQSDARVQGIRLRHNFGKAAALAAGFRSAHGEIVFMLDADLQDDPAEMPRFLETLSKGYDVVSGWKRIRYDPWHKVFPSRMFNAAATWISGCRLHDHNCGFKAFRREVLAELVIYGELHRFIPILAHARGFRVGEIGVGHRPRRFGKTKYGVSRLIKGFLDLITVQFLTRYGRRPLHFLGVPGFGMMLLGAAGLAYLAILWLDPSNRPIGNRPLLIYSAILMALGAQVIFLGVLAELVTSYNVREQDLYSIAERISSKPPDEA